VTFLFECKKRGRVALRRILPARWKAALKARWADYSFRTFRPRIVQHRYGPYEFRLQIVDFDGKWWYDKDWDKSAANEIYLLNKHRLVPGSKVFNVGANQCIYSMIMAREVEPNGFVWAIEPNHNNVCVGRRNCDLNGIHNVEVIEAAVSSTSGQVWISRSMNAQVASSEDEFGAYPVQSVTIDDLSTKLGAPDVLYIDVEGFECEVLKGATTTLQQSQPDCYVEVHLQMGLERFGGSLQELLSFFPSHQYDLFYKPEANGDSREYRRAAQHSDFPTSRFHLVALAK